MLKIEPLDTDAIGRARAIRLRALEDAPDAFWVTAEEEAATTEEEWRSRLTNPDERWFVANIDGQDVGLACGSPHYTHADDAALTAMWVAPESRRQGVADALVRTVIEWAREKGYRFIRLGVADMNEPAMRLYARFGFEPTGETEFLPAPRHHITEHERILDLSKVSS